MVFYEASGDQPAAKNQLTFHEDMWDTIVLDPLPGRTSMATESETPGMSEDATQSRELGVSLEREPRNHTPLITESEAPGTSEDATQSGEPEVDQEISDNDLTIYFAQPAKQPREREQEPAPLPVLGRSLQ